MAQLENSIRLDHWCFHETSPSFAERTVTASASWSGRLRRSWRAAPRWRRQTQPSCQQEQLILCSPRAPPVQDRRASFRFDARELGHLGPLLGFVGKELAEIGRRAGKYRAAGQFKVRLDLRIDESGVDLFVELIDNLGGRVLGGAEAIEHTCLKVGDEFAYGRDVRKCVRTRRRGDRERTQLAGLDVLD